MLLLKSERPSCASCAGETEVLVSSSFGMQAKKKKGRRATNPEVRVEHRHTFLFKKKKRNAFADMILAQAAFHFESQHSCEAKSMTNDLTVPLLCR